MTHWMGFFTAAVGLSTAGTILFLIRRDKLAPGHSLWWMSAAAGVVVLGFFPKIMDVLGRLIGIHYPPILAVLLGLCAVLMKLLFMDIHRSRQERQIRILTQRLGLLEEMKKKSHPED